MNFKTSSITGKPFPTLDSQWSKPLPFTKENISMLPDSTGVYIFLNQKETPIYVGRTINGDYSGLKHRVQSYAEKDDFSVHPTKKILRPHIHSFIYRKTTEEGAKKIEDKLKQFTIYNADNEYNEAKKKE